MSARILMSVTRRAFFPARSPTITFASLTRTTPSRFASSDTKITAGKDEVKVEKKLEPEQRKKKTMAELDAELKLKMEELAGDGGEAGIELEDGQPVAMKRSVRNNMFRYI